MNENVLRRKENTSNKTKHESNIKKRGKHEKKKENMKKQ